MNAVKQQVLVVLTVLAIILAGGVAVMLMQDSANAGNNIPKTAPSCVPSEAWTETIVVTEAWTETIHHDAVPAVTDRVNHTWTGGPVEGPPPVPSEYWQPNNGEHNGQPHQQPDGVPYQVGEGNGDWFLWLIVVVTPGQDAYDEEVEHPAVTREVEHDAVECDDETEPPFEDEGDQPPLRDARCVGNNWTVTITDSDGNMTSSSKPSERCDKDAAKPAPHAPKVVVEEEGM